MDRFNLEGDVVLITGGAGLIGTGFARACASAGATVVVLELDETRAAAVAKKINSEKLSGKVVALKCDITSEEGVKSLIKDIVKKYKRIDGLVNCAFPRTSTWGAKFEDVTYKDFCENLNIHTGGFFLMTREVAKVMEKQKKGAVVSMGSLYAVRAPKFDLYKNSFYSSNDNRQKMAGKQMTVAVEYSAIKGGIMMLTKYWASYLGKYNIRVNAISPGGIWDHQPEDFVKRYNERVPLGGRMATPEDLNYALVFLLSDAARYITGHNLMVDGGWTI